jgi:hypothetical protein
VLGRLKPQKQGALALLPNRKSGRPAEHPAALRIVRYLPLARAPTTFGSSWPLADLFASS